MKLINNSNGSNENGENLFNNTSDQNFADSTHPRWYFIHPEHIFE